jgi:hypothetical protein
MSALATFSEPPATPRMRRASPRQRLARRALDVCGAIALGPWFVVNAAQVAGTVSAIDGLSPLVTLFALPLVALSIGLVRLHVALSGPASEAPKRFVPAMVLLASICLVVSVVGGFTSSGDRDSRASHPQKMEVAK